MFILKKINLNQKKIFKYIPQLPALKIFIFMNVNCLFEMASTILKINANKIKEIKKFSRIVKKLFDMRFVFMHITPVFRGQQ